VVLLLDGVVVSWSLAMDEHGGHEDLRGSCRRSVIPYVHGRTELYCLSLPYLILPFYPHVFPPPEEAHARAFYSSKSDSYKESQGPTGGLDVVETLYNS
jgi:hypothetical protein